MDEVILARHGESEFSLRGLANGDPAVAGPLTGAGVEQARKLGERLREEPIELCVTTEFERTRQTADIVLAGREVPRLGIPELNDIRFGEFEGGLVEGFRTWLREHGAAGVPPGGGESRAETAIRYATGYRKVADRPERLILAIGHAVSIVYILKCARGEDPPLFLEGPPEYAVPFRLSKEELSKAADRLESWAR
ncbi:MAG TPA: histidine phosphatase family protein, partial [Actinomycetota bacterium]|nr:histidine phosphatase family protein [Actinomycetota bacterium]